jgi:WhiB family redox-sensing transcriptional regulator
MTVALTYTPQRWGLDDDWRAEAACAAVDPDLFFPVGVTGPAVDQIVAAKAVCAGCPVREMCLGFAIATNQEYGVWGGTSEEERRVLRRAWRAEQRRTRLADVG